MWIGIVLAAVCSWLFLCATHRVDGPLRGWPGTLLGALAAMLAVWLVHVSGLGLAVSIALALAVMILILPCLSYWQATRRQAKKGAR